MIWLGALAGALAAFLLQVMLARQLGPGAFGAFTAAFGICVMLSPLAGFGLPAWWLRVFGEEGCRARRWVGPSLVFLALSGAVVLVGVTAWALLGPNDATMTATLLVLLGYLLGQAVVEPVASRLKLEERYLLLACWQAVPHLLRLLMVLLAVAVMTGGITPVTVAGAYALAGLVLLAAGGTLLRSMWRHGLALPGHAAMVAGQPRASVSPAGLTAVLTGAWPFGAASVLFLIYTQCGVILANYLAGTEAAGLLAAATTLLTAVYLLPSIYYQKYMLPRFHRWAWHDPQQLWQVFLAGSVVMGLVGLVMMLVLRWLAAPLVELSFGAAFQPAVPVLMLAALGIPLRCLSLGLAALLSTRDLIRRHVALTAVICCLGVLLHVWLILRAQALGAALALVLTELLLLVAYAVAVARWVFRGRPCS